MENKAFKYIVEEARNLYVMAEDDSPKMVEYWSKKQEIYNIIGVVTCIDPKLAQEYAYYFIEQMEDAEEERLDRAIKHLEKQLRALKEQRNKIGD